VTTAAVARRAGMVAAVGMTGIAAGVVAAAVGVVGVGIQRPCTFLLWSSKDGGELAAPAGRAVSSRVQ